MRFVWKRIQSKLGANLIWSISFFIWLRSIQFSLHVGKENLVSETVQVCVRHRIHVLLTSLSLSVEQCQGFKHWNHSRICLSLQSQHHNIVFSFRSVKIGTCRWSIIELHHFVLLLYIFTICALFTFFFYYHNVEYCYRSKSYDMDNKISKPTKTFW